MGTRFLSYLSNCSWFFHQPTLNPWLLPQPFSVFFRPLLSTNKRFWAPANCRHECPLYLVLVFPLIVGVYSCLHSKTHDGFTSFVFLSAKPMTAHMLKCAWCVLKKKKKMLRQIQNQLSFQDIEKENLENKNIWKYIWVIFQVEETREWAQWKVFLLQ